MARMQGKSNSGGDECCAGVDVSKAYLDLRLAGTSKGQRFDNDPAGIARVVASLPAPHLVVLEPTGRFHVALWRALDGAGHKVAPVNPYAARRLAEGMGHLAKTDAVDAFVLCETARRFPPAVRLAPDDMTLEIRGLHAASASATTRRSMVRTEVKASDNPLIPSLLKTEEASLTAQIKALTKGIDALIDAQATTRRTREILTSIPGIGERAALAILEPALHFHSGRSGLTACHWHPVRAALTQRSATPDLNRPGFTGEWFVQRLSDHIK